MSRTRTRSRTRSCVAALAASLALLTAGPLTAALAATGDLDLGFAGDGVASLEGGAGRAQAIARQADGRLVVAGTGGFADGSVSRSGVWVARYDAAGVLDPTFPVARFDVTPGLDTVRGVALDASGRVLVAGHSAATRAGDTTDVFVARLTATGALDRAFGGDGVVVLDRGDHDMAGGVAVSGSRVLVAASADEAGNWANHWTLLALTAGGALDPTFSGDGVADVPTAVAGGSYDGLRDVVVLKDKRVLLGGTGAGSRFTTVRLTAAGAMDATYDRDGAASVLVGLDGAGTALLAQPDGKVVLAGRSLQSATGNDVAAVRWTAAGALDASFSGDGLATVDVSGAAQNDEAWDVALGADEKVVLVGDATTASGGLDLAVARLDWNGTPDTSWSGDGRTLLSTVATGNEFGEAVVVDPSDRITLAGESPAGWQVARFLGGASVNLSVSDASVVEPDTGTVAATFTVRLSAPTTSPVTVRYTTVLGTGAAAASATDLQNRSGTVTLAPGATTATISVPVVGDTLVEPAETFTVKLSKPTDAGLLDATGVGTISNDD